MASQVSLFSSIEVDLSPAPESSISQQTSEPESSPVPNNVPTHEVTKKRTADIWDHSFYPREEIRRNYKGQRIWRCAYCTKEYIDTGSTKNARNHLRNFHTKKLSTHHQDRIGRYQSQIDMAQFRVASENLQYKRRKLDHGAEDDTVEGGRKIDGNVLENLVVSWITACSVPFEMIAQNEFRA